MISSRYIGYKRFHNNFFEEISHMNRPIISNITTAFCTNELKLKRVELLDSLMLPHLVKSKSTFYSYRFLSGSSRSSFPANTPNPQKIIKMRPATSAISIGIESSFRKNATKIESRKDRAQSKEYVKIRKSNEETIDPF